MVKGDIDMRRAIETDFDYKHWAMNELLFSPERKNELHFSDRDSPRNKRGVGLQIDLHTTHPTIYWLDKRLHPKKQLKNSDEMSREHGYSLMERLSRYTFDKEIKTCSDWLHYINNNTSASECTQDGRSGAKNIKQTRPTEHIKITVKSDENDFDNYDFDGIDSIEYVKRSLLSFMVLHNDGKNVILTPLVNGTKKFPYETNIEQPYYPIAEDDFVNRLCSSPKKWISMVNELFVVNINSINDVFRYDERKNQTGQMKFGDLIHAAWDFNTNEEGITEIGEAILGDNLVYDLIPKTNLYVGGNLIEKMLMLPNDEYNKYAMLDLMNELTYQAERVIDTHTVSTTTKVKTSKTTFIPTWKDTRPIKLIDLSDGEFVSYSDILRCPVCNVKVKVIGKATNRQSTAECPLCKTGQITFPHLVNNKGDE
tara:strand:+ start:1215 stop:2489 length:1275 start_codon:yes stop_codon:yes gene_type:complete